MIDIEKEFYAQIGLLSIKFAVMEQKLISICVGLAKLEEPLIMQMVLERNNLEQNLQLTKKINRLTGFKEKEINELIKLIKNVREDRNLFIHGVWDRPVNNDGKISAICTDLKIQYTEVIVENQTVTKSWRTGTTHVFDLEYIAQKILLLNKIDVLQDTLLNEIDQLN